jgi:diaminopimelate epimerase
MKFMTKHLSFTKMHGTGNDFIVLDCTTTPFDLDSKTIQKLANRQKGIGFDQLLVVEQSTNPKMEFKYRIYNADGSEVEQCGNGARCFAIFVTVKGLTNNKEIHVETNTGAIVLTINGDDTVTVDMGKPIFKPSQIPLSVDAESTIYTAQLNNEDIHYFAVSMGNPHAVILKNNIKNLDIMPEAHFFQNSVLFPQSVNVGFLQVLNKKQAKLRVYERGAGETLACGSGACAAIVAGIYLNKLGNKVTVELLGGTVTIEYIKGEHVFLTGPAQMVFEGTIDLDTFYD